MTRLGLGLHSNRNDEQSALMLGACDEEDATGPDGNGASAARHGDIESVRGAGHAQEADRHGLSVREADTPRLTLGHRNAVVLQLPERGVLPEATAELSGDRAERAIDAAAVVAGEDCLRTNVDRLRLCLSGAKPDHRDSAQQCEGKDEAARFPAIWGCRKGHWIPHLRALFRHLQRLRAGCR